jgi:D-xylose transport system permease protein
MSDPAISLDRARSSELGIVARFFKATELDTRLLGMIGAMVVIWLVFQFMTGAKVNGQFLTLNNFIDGQFLTPRNLWNLSVQTSSIAVMATGMVLIIVTRNIDLSVGSILGFVGMIMGVTQAEFLPRLIGFEHPATWIIALGVGVITGALIGGFQGFIIAFLGVPAFIVTLGGLLVWRGAAWWVTSGRTVAPMDSTFRLMGGGPEGSIGAFWSWIVGVIACVAIVGMIINGRRQRKRFNFPRRPIWAEVFMAAVGCVLVLGAVAIANAYYWPIGIVRKYAEANNITIPDGGLLISHGIAIPVLIAVAAGLIMTFMSTRTRFGRYVFAMGGNPEAADLAGINTRWVT